MGSWFEFTYIVVYVTFALGIISLLARFYSRAVVLKSWGGDDTASCFVLVMTIANQVAFQLFLNIGCGKSGNKDCSFQNPLFLRNFFIIGIVIYTTHFAIKSTFLLFYCRLSAKTSFRVYVYIGIALNFAIYLCNILITVLQCIPFEKILNHTLHPEVKCLDPLTVSFTPAVLNIAIDCYILFLPVTIISSLQMTLSRKITILCVLGFGLVSVGVAIARLPLLISVTSIGADVSIGTAKTIVIGAFEVQCAIIAVNLPALKPLWTKFKRGRGLTEHGRITSQGTPHSSSRKHGSSSRSKRGAALSSISRLQGRSESNESMEGLFQQGESQKGIRMDESPFQQSESQKGT